ncbi:MAG: CPBP family intramembrane glutamic endopeptidase [Candidatus Krumholzibacteriia bacterium]
MIVTILVMAATVGLIILLTRGPAAGRANPSPPVDARRAWQAVAVSLVGVALVALLMAAFATGREPGAATPVDDEDLGTAELHCNLSDVISTGLLGLLAAGPVLIYLGRRKETAASVGWTRRGRGRAVGLGLAIGAFWSVVMILRSARPAAEILAGLGAAQAWYFANHLVVGATEELVFRGFLQQRLEAWLGTWRGWLLASLIMALAHWGQRLTVMEMSPRDALLSSLYLIHHSALLGLVMLRSRNLAAPVIVHAFTNWLYVLS